MNFSDMFGKIQEMQQKMKEVQDGLDQLEVQAESGGGMVQVTVTGSKRLKSVKLDPEVQSDPEMLEDLLVAAVNRGMELAEEKAQEEMKKVTGGMLPPGMDLSQFGL